MHWEMKTKRSSYTYVEDPSVLVFAHDSQLTWDQLKEESLHQLVV
jgi:hypothetical protein